MAKREILAGATDQTVDVFIEDSSSSVGGGLTGLAHNTASLTCYYRKGATGIPTALTLATQTVGGAHSDGGFVAVDGTNCPGQYRLDLSDTIVATAGMVTLYLRGATNMVPCLVEIEVVSVNKFDAVRMGLTALPNANAGAAGGLPTDSTGKTSFNDLSQANVRSAVGLASANLDTQLSTIDDFLDTEVAAILAAVDTEVAAILAAVDTEVGTVVTQTTAASIRSAVGLASANLDTQLDALPTAAENADAVWDEATSGHTTSGTFGEQAKTDVDTIVTQTAAASIRTALGLASANLDTQLAAIDDYVDTEVAAILAALDTEITAIIGYVDDIGAAGAGLTAVPWNASWDAEVQSEVDDALKATLTEGYRSTGSIGSVRDMLYELIAHMGESSISGTTKTLKKIDGSTTAKTYTLDSSTTPTSITETT